MTEETLLSQISKEKIPKHIAIIMDGNGRWATRRGLPRIYGHKEGIKSIGEVVDGCLKCGVKVLTLYAFSTENWKRPKDEISFLFKTLKERLRKEKKRFIKEKVRLRVIGDISPLPKGLRDELTELQEKTKHNDRLILNIALNYGGRAEIVRAVNTIISKGLRNITEEKFAKFLYTEDLPEPDLLIRTSGELRISNFLLWQIAYTELYFTPKLWPDFKKEDLYQAIIDYQKRERRFGGI